MRKNVAALLQVFDDAGLWLHLGALIAVAIGVIDLWGFHRLQVDADLALIVAALGAMGLRVSFMAGRSQASAPPGE